MSSLLIGLGQILAFVVHLWTVGIAYAESGLFASIITLVFPMLSEIYWVFMMWGINEPYVFCSILATVLLFAPAFFDSGKSY